MAVLGKQIYRVQLPNQHQLTAHVEKCWRLTVPDFKVGDRVTLKVSPFDLSQGKIVKME
ncbi:MAG: translation initiation factor IF-1 [Verrucomicrobiae bacterium]|nr:translation initiation factor IF-1 [Verrucomicrobiae bacterium]